MLSTMCIKLALVACLLLAHARQSASQGAGLPPVSEYDSDGNGELERKEWMKFMKNTPGKW
eukprot:SAG22_NODE_139_length_18025_cov_4.352058_10_plen_61_part_00